MEEIRIILSLITNVSSLVAIGALVVFIKKTSKRLEKLEDRVKELENGRK